MTNAFHGSNSGLISNDEENPVDFFLNQKYVFMLNSIDYASEHSEGRAKLNTALSRLRSGTRRRRTT